jgi:hypothetical protein
MLEDYMDIAGSTIDYGYGQTAMAGQEIKLRVVVLKEGNYWLAQALERDLCARADSLDKVKARFALLVELEREYSRQHGKAPFDSIDPAPKHFHDMWEQRSTFVQKYKDLDLALCA